MNIEVSLSSSNCSGCEKYETSSTNPTQGSKRLLLDRSQLDLWVQRYILLNNLNYQDQDI